MSSFTSPETKYNPFRSNPSTPNVTGSPSPLFPQPQLGGQAQEQASASGSGSGLANYDYQSAADSQAHVIPPFAFSGPPPASVLAGPSNDVDIKYSNSRPPVPDAEERDLPQLPREGPPPYTPRPSLFSGESTVGQGPARPFQSAPLRSSNGIGSSNSRIPNYNNGSGAFSMSSLSRSSGGGGIIRQLTGTISQVIDEISSARQGGRSSFPGQQQQQYPPQSDQTYRSLSGPPPRHASRPRSPLPPSPSSDFPRDFYIVGNGGGLDLVEDDAPSGSSSRRGVPMSDYGGASSGSNEKGGGGGNASTAPDDGRPTTYPSAGHPLLKDGKLLVYPVGYECEKCYNVGYKKADPDKPCKKCWDKYAKAFWGPLAYSFSSASSSSVSNFQQPLPSFSSTQQHQYQQQNGQSLDRGDNRGHSYRDQGRERDAFAPPPRPPPLSGALSGVADTFTRGISNRLDRRMNKLNRRFDRLGLNPGPQAAGHDHDFGRNLRGGSSRGFGGGPDGSGFGAGGGFPPPGDTRIGGQLCWRCEGRGSTSFLLMDRVVCSVCGGGGRTFE